jgi:hypothetical protein
VFLPATAGLVAWSGWRGAAVVLAGLLVASAGLTAIGVRLGAGTTEARAIEPSVAAPIPPTRGTRLLAAVFGVSSLASASFLANLVPALGERGLPPTTAALLGGLFGVMQLPGRALMVHRRVALSGEGLLAVSLALQAAGLVAVAALPGAAAGFGVATFAAGAGLTALARPYLVQGRFALEHAGLVNGRLARAQQLARAAGPIAASAAAGVTSHATVLVTLAVVLGALAWRVLERQVSPPPASDGVQRRLWTRGPRPMGALTRTRMPHE